MWCVQLHILVKSREVQSYRMHTLQCAPHNLHACRYGTACASQCQGVSSCGQTFYQQLAAAVNDRSEALTHRPLHSCHHVTCTLSLASQDLLLIHWPGASKTPTTSPANAQLRAETWRVLEQSLDNGTARSIGVSNYEQHHLQALLQQASVLPAVNQIEVHPMRQCRQLRAQCAAAGVAVVAYASLGCGALLKERVVHDVAARLGKTPAQVRRI